MSFINRIILVALLFSGMLVHAQENPTGFWQPKASLNYKVSENYKHNFSAAVRFYSYRDGDVVLQTRNIDIAHFSKWSVAENKSVALGIQYRFRDAFEDKGEEVRLTQQFNITHHPSSFRMGHRFRAEQRLLEGSTIFRFRYRLAIDFPLQGEKLDVGEAYFVGSIESLLSALDASNPQYDQRFNVDIGWLLHEGLKLQGGIEYRFEDYNNDAKQVFFLNTSAIFTL